MLLAARMPKMLPMKRTNRMLSTVSMLLHGKPWNIPPVQPSQLLTVRPSFEMT